GLNSLDIRFSMLPFWHDIDTISDLKLLENHLQYLTKKKLKDRKR
ncbi:MAG: hypothetical protein HY758_08150, partial [Nitrospirae bacterium]|nr:hypothetical protein [Nitrospirota bacterium]